MNQARAICLNIYDGHSVEKYNFSILIQNKNLQFRLSIGVRKDGSSNSRGWPGLAYLMAVPVSMYDGVNEQS